ncbi:hypothetical protein GPALN_007811 [Globodera pallida]|nr:hypothetical protein GPALN_007811 [Globodera pallida]
MFTSKCFLSLIVLQLMLINFSLLAAVEQPSPNDGVGAIQEAPAVGSQGGQKLSRKMSRSQDNNSEQISAISLIHELAMQKLQSHLGELEQQMTKLHSAVADACCVANTTRQPITQQQ